jgi:type II secretory pathway predicted ATPase ExeA
MLTLWGGPGVGKTRLALRLLDELWDQYTTVWLTNPRASDVTGLLQAILFDLDRPYAGRSEQELRLELQQFSLKAYDSGTALLLAIDEAQHLSLLQLEELRLLTNLQSCDGPIWQILLIGQPSLREALCHSELLMQRIGVWAEVTGLSHEESLAYLSAHLRLVGGPSQLFTPEALDLLARGCQGVPRLLGLLAHEALVLTDLAEESQVGAEAVLEALRERGLLGVRLNEDESLAA